MDTINEANIVLYKYQSYDDALHKDHLQHQNDMIQQETSLTQEKAGLQDTVAQSSASLQDTVAQSSASLQGPVAQSSASLQGPVAQSSASLQGPVAQSSASLQGPVAQSSAILKNELWQSKWPSMSTLNAAHSECSEPLTAGPNIQSPKRHLSYKIQPSNCQLELQEIAAKSSAELKNELWQSEWQSEWPSMGTLKADHSECSEPLKPLEPLTAAAALEAAAPLEQRLAHPEQLSERDTRKKICAYLLCIVLFITCISSIVGLIVVLLRSQFLI